MHGYHGIIPRSGSRFSALEQPTPRKRGPRYLGPQGENRRGGGRSFNSRGHFVIADREREWFAEA